MGDAYADERFNQSFDMSSGYVTKTILCMPIIGKSPENALVGVIQLINKADAQPFDTEDERLMGTFLHIAGPILEDSQLFMAQQKRESTNEIEKIAGHIKKKEKMMPTLGAFGEEE